jgi:putative membrane protein
MLSSKENKAIAILIILYAVGIGGMLLGYEGILKLTPINLIVSVGIMFWFHPQADRRLVLYSGIVFFSGFIIEWAGVRTGKIFGQYFYGENLGIKLFDIPLIIGVNWIMLSYASMQVVHKLFGKFYMPNHQLIHAFIGALLMVIVDVLIEAICGRLDFWYWKDQVPPLQNYSAWFTFSFAFNFLYKRLQINSGNGVAVALFIIQVIFFLVLNLHFALQG